MLSFSVAAVLAPPLAGRIDDSQPLAELKSPTTPEQGLQSIRVPDGFVVDLVASEPDVQDPVAFAWDENGRMFVVEMPDYPLGPRSGRVKLLEDRDGNGRMDHSSVFADDLNFPDSVFPWRGGVLVAAAPDIIYLKDSDGDGRADERRTVLTGFGEGNPQHRVNGLVWGIDNWIYGANGDSDGLIKAPQFPDRPGVAVRRRDFRLRPDDSVIEPVAGNSQFGIAFDDWGNRFVCNNSAHIRHVVLGTRYVDSNPVIGVASVIEEIAEHGSKSRIFPISKQPARFNDPLDLGRFSAACGIHVYRGDLFPAEFRGNAFVCDAVGNLVHRDVLAPAGVTLAARRGPDEQDREFFASTDTWCRPVYLATGPDGALYVVDMYRAVIEHPEWIPDSIEKKLDLRAGSDRGRIYRVRPKVSSLSPPPRLGQKTSRELVALLQHANGWWRDTAQRLLFERQDGDARLELVKMFRASRSPVARLHALWTLHGLATLDDALVEQALADSHAAVREHALRLSEGRLAASPSLRAAAFKRQDDPDVRVRFQLVCTLGELNDAESVKVLARLAARDASDAWCRTAVLLSAYKKAGTLLKQLAAQPTFSDDESTSEHLSVLNQLAFMVGYGGEASQVADLFESFSDNSSLTRRQFTILAGLANGLSRGGHSLRRLLDNATPAGNSALKRLADVQKLADDAAREASRPLNQRVDAVRLLGLGPSSSESVLAEFLRPHIAEPLQAAAIRTIGESGDPHAPALLVDGWAGFSPATRRVVLEVVFQHRHGADAILSAIESGRLARAEIEPARRAQLLNHPLREIKDRSNTVFAQEMNPDRRRVIAEFADVATLDGDRSRGESLFQKHCVQCHTVQRVGHAVGPELVGVRKRERAALLEDLLNPNAALSPAFVNYIVATKSGRVVSGIIVNESATNITLRRAESAEDTVPRDEIEEIQSTGQSLMPEGLEKSLSRQELADLIEYVRQIQ